MKRLSELDLGLKRFKDLIQKQRQFRFDQEDTILLSCFFNVNLCFLIKLLLLMLLF